MAVTDMKFLPPRLFSLICAAALAGCGGGNSNDESAFAPRFLAQTSTASREISLPGNRADYSITKKSEGWIFTDTTGKISPTYPPTFARIDFADVSVALDIDGAAGQIYRLYQAAFNRVPDLAGVGFWLAANEAGATMEQIADAFIRSAEFQSLYGPTPTNDDFVTKLYLNALHRAPDPSGRAFWIKVLESDVTRAAILGAFSESVENKTATALSTQDGIPYARAGVVYRPVASAGPNQSVNVGTLVALNGSGSSDANGDPLKYSWTLSRPIGSLASLSSSSDARPTLRPDSAGVYTISLTVSDGKLSGNAQSIVTANAPAPKPPVVADSGLYTCTSITHSLALILYAQGHTYLDRDHDGKPCEATDIAVEHPITVPIVTVPSSGQCFVNGYYRANGTYVSGYWRRC